MKRFFCFVLCFLGLFLFVGCNKSNPDSVNALDVAVTQEMESIENVDSLDDESLKALSIVVRTRLKNNLQVVENYTPKNMRIYNIVKQTSETFLTDGENNATINFEKNKTWQKSIKKYSILKFLSKKDIFITSVSNISPVFNEDGTIKSLKAGENYIDFTELKKEFNLPTNTITDFKIYQTEIVVFGTYPENDFEINQIVNMSISGKSYKEILVEMYPKFEINEKK